MQIQIDYCLSPQALYTSFYFRAKKREGENKICDSSRASYIGFLTVDNFLVSQSFGIYIKPTSIAIDFLPFEGFFCDGTKRLIKSPKDLLDKLTKSNTLETNWMYWNGKEKRNVHRNWFLNGFRRTFPQQICNMVIIHKKWKHLSNNFAIERFFMENHDVAKFMNYLKKLLLLHHSI